MKRNIISKAIAKIMVATLVTVSGINLMGDKANFTTVAYAATQSKLDFSVKVTRTDWGTGHNGFISLTAKEMLKNWTLEFDYAGEITSSGNCNIYKDGDHYKITPKNWNTILMKDRELKLDYLGKKSNKAIAITNITLYDNQHMPVKINDWKLKNHYKVGDIVEHKGKFYKCRLEHTADAFNWSPDFMSALWIVDRSVKSYDVNISK